MMIALTPTTRSNTRSSLDRTRRNWAVPKTRAKLRLRAAVADWQAEFDLTPMELSVVERLVQGCANKEIARDLGSSVATVRTHLANVFRKLGTASRGEVSFMAFCGAFGAPGRPPATPDPLPDLARRAIFAAESARALRSQSRELASSSQEARSHSEDLEVEIGLLTCALMRRTGELANLRTPS
jgi:DNA-binding CsgD family transcriptional regulator